jgi:hypothetical protein
MEFFVNILTLTACFATMAYCYVLAKRIHAFHNIKDGVGALIEEMIRTTSDLQIAFNTTQHNIDNQYHRLQDKIDEGVALTEYLSSVLQEVDEASNHLYSLKTEITFTQQAQQAQKYKNHTIKQSTLPDDFRLPHHLEKSSQSSFQYHDTGVSDVSDPLEDVMPADFDSLKRKKRPKMIIQGDEYL